MKMPAIDLALCGLTPEEKVLAEGILNSRTGCLRASKPKINYDIVATTDGRKYRVVKDDGSGETAYIWRMVCYQLIPYAPHCCVPMCAQFDLPGWHPNKPTDREAEKALIKKLDALADKICAPYPKSGLLVWRRALLGY